MSATSSVRRPPPPGRSLAGALVLLLCASCMPMVTHGPIVEEGVWTGSNGSFRLGTLLEGEVDALGSSYAVRPPNGFFARYGWRGWEGGPTGLSVGAHLPFAIPFSVVQTELDVYAQLTPPAAPLDGGAGLLASPAYLMPYGQVGGPLRGLDSWYTTQGLTLFGYAGGAPRAVIWSPAVVWRRGRLEQSALLRRSSATHLFVQGGFGSEWVPAEEGPDRRRRVRFLLIGISTEASGWPRLPDLGIPGL